jgi:hypothetical protein
MSTASGLYRAAFLNAEKDNFFLPEDLVLTALIKEGQANERKQRTRQKTILLARVYSINSLEHRGRRFELIVLQWLAYLQGDKAGNQIGKQAITRLFQKFTLFKAPKAQIEAQDL